MIKRRPSMESRLVRLMYEHVTECCGVRSVHMGRPPTRSVYICPQCREEMVPTEARIRTRAAARLLIP